MLEKFIVKLWTKKGTKKIKNLKIIKIDKI